MTTLILTISPDRILIGGGIGIGRPFLLPMIRARTERLLNGYLGDLSQAALKAVIRAPNLGANAGPLGAVALALAALE